MATDAPCWRPAPPPRLRGSTGATTVTGQTLTESVGVVERLVALAERQEARQAEKDFNAAFVALQADLPTITAKTVIPNRGKYERFEDCMKVVGPLLTKHGFSVSFSMGVTDGRITHQFMQRQNP